MTIRGSDAMKTIGRKVAKLLPYWEYESYANFVFTYQRPQHHEWDGLREQKLTLSLEVVEALCQTVDRLDNLQDTIRNLKVW